MAMPQEGPKPDTSERIEEYKAVLDNLGQYGNHRHNANAVFVGFNTVFLAGLGALLVSAHFESWQIVVQAGAVSLVTMPVNYLWRLTLIQYTKGLDLRYQYLQAVEGVLRQRWGDDTAGLETMLYKPATAGSIQHRHTPHRDCLGNVFSLPVSTDHTRHCSPDTADPQVPSWPLFVSCCLDRPPASPTFCAKPRETMPRRLSTIVHNWPQLSTSGPCRRKHMF